ncbi:MAG TPA: hypothetical protein PKM87_03560, partial [Methanolinea sp.]|nr:hypothetical protein [Methanolinea sp.]
NGFFGAPFSGRRLPEKALYNQGGINIGSTPGFPKTGRFSVHQNEISHCDKKGIGSHRAARPGAIQVTPYKGLFLIMLL